MIRALIVDDEPLARENLVLRVAEQNDFEVCGQADNGHDAALLASNLSPDVIFLDINMPGVNGLDAANDLMSEQDAAIVFVTAYSEHAIDAFRVNALDYIVKPIDDNIFINTIERVRNRVRQKNSLRKLSIPQNTYLKRLGIKDGSSIHMLDVNDIEIIEAAGDYLCITTRDKNYIHKQTLKSLLNLLDPLNFIRIHRSSALNLMYLESIETNDGKLTANLKNRKKMQISRRYSKAVREKVADLENVHR